LLLGLAAFTKGYALFFYPAPLLMWLLLGRTISRQQITTLLTVTYATASIAWLLMFSIGWHIYQRELTDKSIAGPEDSSLVVQAWSNAALVTDWLTVYLTWPVIMLLMCAGAMIIIKRDKPGWLLLTLIGGSIFAFVIGFTDLNSRYLFPLIVPFSVVIGWTISELATLIGSVRLLNHLVKLSSGLLMAVAFLAICLPGLIFSYQIVVTPYDAPLPEKDKADYIVNAQSPFGYQDVAQSIDSLVERNSRVTFLRHGLPSPLAVILSVYLSDKARQHLEFVYIRDLEQITPQSLDDYASQAPTLTVKNDLITANAAGPDALTYAQLWPLASFSNPDYPSDIGVYQWLLPPDFAIRWFQQGGDAEPRIAWWPDKGPITASNGKLIDGAALAGETPEAFQQTLVTADIEYILATPELVSQRPDAFGTFIDTDGAVLSLRQLPPGWRLAFAYPDLKCEWCLFQTRPPDYPTYVNFADTIELEGYDLARSRALDVHPVHVTLYWHSLASLPGPYVVFVHALNEDGQLVAQVDEPPLLGIWPTDQWQVGSRLADRHTLHFDATLAEGIYTITVGLYDPTTLARLPVKASEKVAIDHAVAITTITLGEDTDPSDPHALN